jgi:hypothetical protein
MNWLLHSVVIRLTYVNWFRLNCLVFSSMHLSLQLLLSHHCTLILFSYLWKMILGLVHEVKVYLSASSFANFLLLKLIWSLLGTSKVVWLQECFHLRSIVWTYPWCSVQIGLRGWSVINLDSTGFVGRYSFMLLKLWLSILVVEVIVCWHWVFY